MRPQAVCAFASILEESHTRWGFGMTDQVSLEDGDKGAKDALTFARKIAKQEIDSIERIHKRTLQSFAYIGIAVAATAGIFGYIGYSNLRDAAIATAENQVRTEVTREVREKLTQENIESIVQDQVRNYSETKLQDAVHKALMAPTQLQIIRTAAATAAADESRSQMKKQFAPRHFTKEQSDAFVKAVNEQPGLTELPVAIMPGMSIEAEEYAKEISSSVARTKLKVTPSFRGFNASPIEGVAIYRDKASPELPARLLQEAFRACGIEVKIVAAPSPLPNELPAGEKVPLVIFVGVRF